MPMADNVEAYVDETDPQPQRVRLCQRCAPSPILPDGSPRPLPIPSDEPPRLKDVLWRGEPLSNIVSAITNQRIGALSGVHLDPDLQEQARPRAPGWLPLFGQVDAAQSHLENCGVGVGDLFLFFGWFRRTIRVDGHLMFDRSAPITIASSAGFEWVACCARRQRAARFLSGPPSTLTCVVPETCVRITRCTSPQGASNCPRSGNTSPARVFSLERRTFSR